MRKFRFRLDRLLEYRQKQEEAAVLALAAARELEAQARETVDCLEGELCGMDADRLRAQGEDAWVDVMAIAEAASRLVVRLEAARIRLVDAERVTEQCRVEAVARLTDRKVVDKLKDKARSAHDAEALSEEQKESDDISTTRHGKEV